MSADNSVRGTARAIQFAGIDPDNQFVRLAYETNVYVQRLADTLAIVMEENDRLKVLVNELEHWNK